MLNIKQTQKVLDRFRLHVVKESRKNLTNKQKNASKGLYKSIYGEVKAMPNSIFLEFGMNQYGTFQDKGVSGKQKKYDTKFSFKNKRPPSKPFEEWAKKKGIKPKNENVNEDLRRWFKEKWVDVSKKVDGKHPPCGRKDADGKSYPKCRPSKKVSSETPKVASSYDKDEKKAMTQQKRRAEKKDPKVGTGNKPTMTSYKKK